ncbi:MAG: threonylcarbamoyl-AMP synthase [Candidatus Aenigmarchaeota archaeon]|nr:threonylcarbamoyl-AMP synthase [Candidatus Aenigmarchaeota archaeon]
MKTVIIKANDSMNKAVEILKRGGLIIYPTETQYGIGADVSNDEAIRKVLEVKKRQEDKKIIWAFSDMRMIKKYFSLNKEQEKLVSKLMPGPFTLVVNGQGFRIPDNKTAAKIIKQFGKPITTTSANISGKDPPNKIADVVKLFDGKVDIIIDTGNIRKNRPSTVFRWEDKRIVRKGPMNRKEIMEALKS